MEDLSRFILDTLRKEGDMSRKRSVRQLAWEKSGGNCCLCGLPMQLFKDDQSNSNPLAFTVEHLLPKTQGGTNDLDNIDGSHRFCNAYKGGESMEELPAGYKKFLRWKVKNIILHTKV